MFLARVLASVMLLLTLTSPARAADEPLSLWNDSPSRNAIIDFVTRTTTNGSSDFLPPEQRVAVFDNDGTLWSEQPMYFQGLFVFDRIRELAPQHPEWKTKEPYASILKGDYKKALAGGDKALITLVMATHAGMTADEFSSIVAQWLATAEHPTLKRHYTELVYAPMLQLLDYLRANGYKTFIVSGGGIEFMRVFAEKTYGIPPEQTIGSSIKTKFEMKDGKPQIIRLPQIDFVNDGPGKPVGIARFIGRKPVMAFGNSDGDIQMLQYTTGGSGPHLGVIVHHTDATREVAYDRQSSVGKLDKGLDIAAANGWILVDMKHDWKKVYPFE
ncbi:HAD family hydrolase [Silvimonas amylolytica]|uniref:phosphoserine phosphatase n=1 Tax=Silvimonas amylolytica TaxID=449663 RepID=A0ABQ2PNP6_9NEIS|nr:HAD family hydrolase [Silvimonas amylolytica]GGP27077.1 haloacid dehalogenase [Silvimonas amylolytica]